jgi:hypothetical protein
MLRAMSLATALGAVIACSGAAPPPAHQVPPPVAIVVDAGPPADAGPLDRDLPRLIERSLAMYRDIAAAFAASGEDCEAATAKLGELTARDRDVVTANAKVLHDGRAAELRAALEAHGEAFDAAARAVMQSPTLARCARDRTFARAFDQLFEAPP